MSKTSIIQKLDSTSPAQLAGLPEVADKFKHIYSIMNGGNESRAAVKYEAEKFHFMKLIQDNPALQQCTKLSLYGCFLDMAVNGLSFDPNMKHAYVVSFSNNVGTKQQPKWEKRATLMISGQGELHMRVQQKQIKYADNPILVYEGDIFKHGTKNGSVFIEHEATFPRKSDTIIACYVRIERNDGSVDYKVLSIEEVMKLRAFSKDPNSKAWVEGLPGMIQAKTIKHAFKSYPKMRMGQFSGLQSEIVDADAEQEVLIDYGLNGCMPSNNLSGHTVQFAPSMVVDTVKNEDEDEFAKTSTKPGEKSVSFEDDNF